jgi:dipeptidyl aminopeptidase/acylaminoacyl peptidase
MRPAEITGSARTWIDHGGRQFSATPARRWRGRAVALLAVLLATLGVPAAAADNAASEPGPPVAGPIVFVRDGVIHTINPDGSGERPLREGANPELSPDGSRVAFDHPGPTGTRDIWEMNADGSGAAPLLSGEHDHVAPSWSPDGARLVVEADRPDADLLIVELDGSVSVLARAPYDEELDFQSSYHRPKWSPDGQLISFIARGFRRSGPVVIRPDGSDLRFLSGYWWEGTAAWSPDSRTIVTFPMGPPCPLRLVVIEVATGAESCLPGSDGFVEAAWAPDGQRLVADTGDGELWTIRPDGSDRRHLTTGTTPHWGADPQPDLQFTDVPEGHAHATGIGAVARAGITVGYPDGTFRPQSTVTRAQMATFLMRALDLPPGSQSFTDVPEGHAHATGIGAVAAAGITVGYPDGTFRPQATVTRAQMATFLMRALDLA